MTLMGFILCRLMEVVAVHVLTAWPAGHSVRIEAGPWAAISVMMDRWCVGDEPHLYAALNRSAAHCDAAVGHGCRHLLLHLIPD
mgnify:CR=1 FL=1